MISVKTIFGENASVLREQNFQILFLANIFPSIGTALLSPVLDSLVAPLGTTSSNVGLMISAYTAPGILIIPITGLIADRLGRKPVLVVGLVLFGLGGTLIAFTTDFRVALGLRFLQGIGFACLGPILIASLGDLYHGSVEATAQGIRFTGSGLSQTVFPLASGSLVIIAWQYPFFLFALAFPTALLVSVYFDEPKTIAEAASETARNGGGLRSQLRNLAELTGNRRVYSIVVARCFPSVVWIGFLTYNSIIVIRVLDGSSIQAGILAAIGSLCFSIAATQAGRITAAFDTRFAPLVGASVALAVGFITIVVAPVMPFATIGIIAVGGGFGLALSLYRSALNEMAPASLRGSLVSLSEAIGRLASTLTPIVIGGSIAALTPLFGFEQAVQATVVGVSLFVGIGSLLCLVFAYRAPPAAYTETPA